LKLEANINVRDSLADGKSYFLVEVERVKDVLDEAAQTPFVLTVFDELFRGTNSNERLAASREIARRLAAQGSLCLLATHDLELTRLVNEEAVEGIAALHFRDEIEAGHMVFPYVAHRGVSGVHNALRLLELSGYPADLVARAQEFARTRLPDTPDQSEETPRAPGPEGS
jgi:DNA mismatch repair ATPase MutS